MMSIRIFQEDGGHRHVALVLGSTRLVDELHHTQLVSGSQVSAYQSSNIHTHTHESLYLGYMYRSLSCCGMLLYVDWHLLTRKFCYYTQQYFSCTVIECGKARNGTAQSHNECQARVASQVHAHSHARVVVLGVCDVPVTSES